MRSNWDETWGAVAKVIATRSRCSRMQVGAVIVDSSNRIVATGYNGPPAMFVDSFQGDCRSFCKRGKDGPTEETVYSYTDCPSIHAEANALMFCDRKDRRGGTIYVTYPPCWSCAKMIANSGLLRVCITSYGQKPPFDASISEDIMLECGLHIAHV